MVVGTAEEEPIAVSLGARQTTRGAARGRTKRDELPRRDPSPTLEDSLYAIPHGRRLPAPRHHLYQPGNHRGVALPKPGLWCDRRAGAPMRQDSPYKPGYRG